MSDWTFEREARTPFSEAYAIQRDGEPAGRVDVHFTPSSIAHATLCVGQDVDDGELEELIGEVDERLVLTADPYRDDFVVTVWRGEAAGVYSEDDDAEDDEEETTGNGRAALT